METARERVESNWRYILAWLLVERSAARIVSLPVTSLISYPRLTPSAVPPTRILLVELSRKQPATLPCHHSHSTTTQHTFI